MYIFLDESGQFYKNNFEKYFVIGSFTVGDVKRAAKRFRAWCRKKFPKKMRNRPEIKYSDSGISDDLRLKTIRYLSQLDVRIRYCFIRCLKIIGKINITKNPINQIRYFVEVASLDTEFHS